jgi:hypothetical protein
MATQGDRTRSDVPAPTFTWLRRDEADHAAVLQRMLDDAAAQIPGLSRDPTLTDPLVRLLLGAVAREYARLYAKLDSVIGLSYEKLVESLLAFPRAPVPSSTVLQLSVKDPATRVDEGLQVVGRKAVTGEGGQQEERAIHFGPVGEALVPGVGGPAVLLQTAAGEVRLLADGSEELGAPVAGGASWRVPATGQLVLHLGLDVPDGLDVPEVPVFVLGEERAVLGLIWATWEAGADDAGAAYVPGSRYRLQPWSVDQEALLLRVRSDQRRPYSPYDRHFVPIDLAVLRAGRGAVPAAATEGIAAGKLASVPNRCWVRVKVSAGVGEAALQRARLLANCVVAFNQNSETAKINVGGDAVHLLDLPVAWRQVFRIDSVLDAANTLSYVDAETPDGLASPNRYYFDRSPDGVARLRLTAAERAVRPRKIEVAYTTTHGAEADGLAPGSINLIYDRRLCPGVLDAVNVAPSRGGGAPAEPQHHVAELRSALASRARAVTALDYRALAAAFDPTRIVRAEVGRGVARTAGGVGSCVTVTARHRTGAFTSDLEREAFQDALQRDLQARAPAGQIVVVQLAQSDESTPARNA